MLSVAHPAGNASPILERGNMKSVIILWILALVVGVGSLKYIDRVLDNVQYSSTIWANNEPLQLDEAIKSGGLAYDNEKPVTQAENSSDMQVAWFDEEADTPALALQNTQSPQVTLHGYFLQQTGRL